MMDEDRKPMDIGKRSSIESKVIDIPLISRDDETWTQFMGAENVAEVALRGQWLNSDTRGLLWRLLLGVIPRGMPPSLWREHMSCKRQEYQDLRAEHRVDIAKVVDRTDPMSANPLFSGSSSGDDPWSHFYERKEMIDTIKADLERLYPTGCGEHFLAPARQELLLSVLSLWADLHPDTGYRQGMHEVLAPFVLALEKEVAAATRAAARTKSSSSPSNGNLMEASAHVGTSAALNEVSSSEDLEADAFWLFSAVMTGLEGFYEHGGMRSVQQRFGGGGQVGTRDGLDSPVVEMCKRIQGSRMREADPELQRHLAHLDISPQLYGMKWARLLFGREFRVERVLQLWDHIFASSWLEGRPDLPECVEGVAVAMVLSVRNELLAEDSTGCLQLLMRYPPDQSVFTIINLSLALGQPRGYRHADTASSSPRSDGVLCPSSGPSESVPAWLMDGGKTGVDSGNGLARRTTRNTLNKAGERLQRPGADRGGVVGGRGSAGASFGKEGGIERRGNERNNWQQGLDEFTRRAFSAAQDVAKMAVHTVERSQHGEAPVAVASTSQALARRLRTVCAAMEGGKVSVQAAAEDIREVARLLERGNSGRLQSANHVTSSGSVGQSRSDGGGSVGRAFSTYSEDDGCADSLYTRDL